MSGTLSHVRVLDLSRILAGPWATQIFADMGADVIKIEKPGVGDDTRDSGPPFLRDREGNETKEAAYYLSCNRGKRSLTLDISKPEGQAIIKKIAAQCDVVVENYKVGTLKRYGLDYESLKVVKPDLIYCSITGFGQTGPYRDRPGYDFIFQGMSGLMSITGERDELPGGGPQKLGVAFSDLTTGLYTAIAVLSALSHRQATGIGQYIDLALLDVVVGLLANMNSNYLVSGNVPVRMGNAHANLVPYQVFKTSDGHAILAVGNDKQFASFRGVAGRPELASDERYATNPGRVRNRAELIPVVAAIMEGRSTSDWIAVLEPANVSCGPINNIEQALSNPQVVSRGMVVELPHPLSGTVKLAGSPLRFSETPVQLKTPPLLGQHSEEVLRELAGCSGEDIAALRSSRII